MNMLLDARTAVSDPPASVFQRQRVTRRESFRNTLDVGIDRARRERFYFSGSHGSM